MKSRPAKRPRRSAKRRRATMDEVIPVRLYADERQQIQDLADATANGNASALIRELIRARISDANSMGVAA